MTTILAYCDPISAAPGDAVRFMVSCEGASEYQAEIVRLINPQAEPVDVRLGERTGWLVDLRGRPLEPFEGGFTLRPHGMATASIALPG